MENSIYIAMSRQTALKQQMSAVANNIANINTPGYKANKIMFEEYIKKPKLMDEELSMVSDYGQYTVTSQGQLQLTGNSLDIGLDGPGFFLVETPEGTQYTRAGNFKLNLKGEIVTNSGLRVLDNGEKTVAVPQGTSEISIDERGLIRTETGVVGQVGIFEFENIQLLNPTGSGLYKAPEPGLPATQTKAKQGMLEKSNVKSVMEMTNMIEISRQYQSTQRMIQNEHERLRGVIQKLTNTQG